MTNSDESAEIAPSIYHRDIAIPAADSFYAAGYAAINVHIASPLFEQQVETFIFSAALAKRLSLPAAKTFIAILPAWDVYLAAWQKNSYKRRFGRAFWYASGRNSRFIKLKRFAARTAVCAECFKGPFFFVVEKRSGSFRVDESRVLAERNDSMRNPLRYKRKDMLRYLVKSIQMRVARGNKQFPLSTQLLLRSVVKLRQKIMDSAL